MQIDDTQTDPHNLDSPNPSFNQKFESYRFRKSDDIAIRTKKTFKTGLNRFGSSVVPDYLLSFRKNKVNKP